MNYLAHLYLAGTSSADRVGGLMGDFVKGPLPGRLPQPLADGVALHRAIDAWAEGHPAFRASRARVSAARRRVSGIMVDLFYDHFLALHWTRFVPRPLEAFARDAYAEVAREARWLPEPLAAVLPAMQRHDWLSSYRDPANVAFALERMAERRLRQPNPLAGGGAELGERYGEFEADFLAFLPDARAFADDWRARRDAGRGAG
ncbi:acyl carrier protein phosphodiesterase [Chitiniphilus shinanonensis]|nr:ACP phosphodiesterase [Chitiniphilus shinanonensis]